MVLALVSQRWITWVLAGLWVVMMAWSRTYLEAHWLSDVAGGAILGSSVAVLTVTAVLIPDTRVGDVSRSQHTSLRPNPISPPSSMPKRASTPVRTVSA